MSHSGPDYSTSDSITLVYPYLQGFKKHVKFHILFFFFLLRKMDEDGLCNPVLKLKTTIKFL